MALEPSDLNPTDTAILDELSEGRCTPAFIADSRGYTSGNVRNRMTHLASHGHVTALGGGMYELLDDPRASPEPDDTDDVDDGREWEGSIEAACTDLERALSQIPEGTPGRMAVEDAASRLGCDLE